MCTISMCIMINKLSNRFLWFCLFKCFEHWRTCLRWIEWMILSSVCNFRTKTIIDGFATHHDTISSTIPANSIRFIIESSSDLLSNSEILAFSCHNEAYYAASLQSSLTWAASIHLIDNLSFHSLVEIEFDWSAVGRSPKERIAF